MKMKYCIGFFTGIFLFVTMLGIGYQLSYRYVIDRQQARLEAEAKQGESVRTKGNAAKNEGYYLAELHGYLVVYLSDKSTIYEVTNIPFSDLPEEVQTEIEQEKYVQTEAELYSFLENYSS